MKRFVCCALLLLMLFMAACAGAETDMVTATPETVEDPYDALFSNGYRGFCLDQNLHAADTGDQFSIAESTSAARDNSKDKNDISQKLKLLFTLYFKDIFVSDGNGGYKMDSNKADSSVSAVVYHYTDGRWLQPKTEAANFRDGIDAYVGPEIPDEDYELPLSNGDIIEFSFKVFEPEKEGIQSYFAYKITVKDASELKPTKYTVTVTPSEGGSVSADKPEAKEGETVTLTVTPSEGYELKSLKVNGSDVLKDEQTGEYTFEMPAEDVTVTAQWTQNEYTVTFVGADDEVLKTEQVKHGGSATAPEVIAPEGYTFAGWDKEFDNVTGPLTVTAQWEKNPAQVTVKPAGEGGEVTVEREENGVVTLLIRANAGYELDTLKVNGADVTDQVNGNGEYTFTPDEDVTVEATFKEIPPVHTIEIVRQPEDQHVTEGQRAEFSVEAQGDGLTYQWYVDYNDGSGFKPIPGANGAQYVTSVTTAGNDGYRYFCRINDAHGNSVDSIAAALHVSAMPELPKTGDNAQPMLWAALLALACAGMAMLSKRAKI